MTIKEFSLKYHVDYNMVYNSTWSVNAITNTAKNREFDESELLQAVRLSAKRREAQLRADLKRIEGILDRCRM